MYDGRLTLHDKMQAQIPSVPCIADTHAHPNPDCEGKQVKQAFLSLIRLP
jgi:hypothetical protein